MATPLAFLPKVRSKAITDAARGMPCTLRLPCCNGRTDTTVFAHLPGFGRGMSTKVSDLNGVFACHACHDAIDRGHKFDPLMVAEAMLRGWGETLARLVEADVIAVKNGKIL